MPEKVANDSGYRYSSQMIASGSSEPASWTLNVLQRMVARLLERDCASVSTDDDILDQGLDSVRLMLLIEELRAQGADIDFLDLAQFTTLADWAQLLATRGFVQSVEASPP